MTKALSFGGTLDKPWQIRHHEGALTHSHQAEVGDERRKRKVTDFRFRRSHRRKQRRLARVREADQPDVGQKAQFEMQRPLLSWLSFFREGWRLPNAGGEVQVPPPSLAASSGDGTGLRLREVGEQFACFGIADEGSNRHSDLHVSTVFAVPLSRTTGRAVLGTIIALESEIQQRVHAFVSHKYDVSPFAAVTAVWPAPWDMLFPAKRGRAIASLAGGHPNLDLINKHRCDEGYRA